MFMLSEIHGPWITFSAPVVAALISALLAPLLLSWFQTRQKKALSSPMQKDSVNGEWSGICEQMFGDGSVLVCKLFMALTMSKDAISGNGWVNFSLDGTEIVQKFKFRGDFVRERFLQLEYNNDTNGVMQFGVMFFHFDDNGTVMTGALVGYGPLSKRIVTADVKMRKIIDLTTAQDRPALNSAVSTAVST